MIFMVAPLKILHEPCVGVGGTDDLEFGGSLAAGEVEVIEGAKIS